MKKQKRWKRVVLAIVVETMLLVSVFLWWISGWHLSGL